MGGFPGGAVVENLPANSGDTGSSPGLGRSHMLRSNWARKPQLLSLHVWSLCSATREATRVRGPRTVMKSGPRLPQLEKALAQKRRSNTAKNKKIKLKKTKNKKQLNSQILGCAFLFSWHRMNQDKKDPRDPSHILYIYFCYSHVLSVPSFTHTESGSIHSIDTKTQSFKWRYLNDR